MLPTFGMPFSGVPLSNEPLADVGFSHEQSDERAAIAVFSVQLDAQFFAFKQCFKSSLGFARAADFALPSSALLLSGAGRKPTRMQLGRVDAFQPAVQIVLPDLKAQVEVEDYRVAVDHADEFSVVELGRRRNTQRTGTKNSK